MTDLLSLWHRAASASLGIRIKTDDPALLRQQLYAARGQDGGFQDLSIILPSTPNQLWIVHKDADERGTFDKIHAQPIYEGPRFPSKKGGQPNGQSGNPEGSPETSEGDGE